jgi:HK97 gp10 family phage protein
LENDTRHFWLVEFGTAKTKAQPFLRPALEDNVQTATEAFADQIKKDILTDIS